MGSAMARMRARWNSETMDALMLLAPCSTALGYDGRGDFEMDPWGSLKRRAELKLAPFVWTGLQILHPRLFDTAPKGRFSINRLWDEAIGKARLSGVRLESVWIPVGTPDGLTGGEASLGDLARQPC